MIRTFQDEYGVQVLHAWGMTEMTPLGTVSRPKSYQMTLSEAERFAIRAKQGIPAMGVEIRAMDETGKDIGKKSLKV